MEHQFDPSEIKPTNAYGIYADFKTWPEGERISAMNVSGENLAAKLIFPDRVIRIHWSGRIEVEPR